MANKSNLLKKIAIPVFIILVVVGGYFFFLKDSELLQMTVQAPPDAEITRIESEVVTLLDELQGLSLSGDIFNSPAFNSLKDFSIELTPEPVGRDNPFAPIGSVSSDSL